VSIYSATHSTLFLTNFFAFSFGFFLSLFCVPFLRRCLLYGLLYPNLCFCSYTLSFLFLFCTFLSLMYFFRYFFDLSFWFDSLITIFSSPGHSFVATSCYEIPAFRRPTLPMTQNDRLIKALLPRFQSLHQRNFPTSRV
jgi:hypothetical protein